MNWWLGPLIYMFVLCIVGLVAAVIGLLARVNGLEEDVDALRKELAVECKRAEETSR